MQNQPRTQYNEAFFNYYIPSGERAPVLWNHFRAAPPPAPNSDAGITSFLSALDEEDDNNTRKQLSSLVYAELLKNADWPNLSQDMKALIIAFLENRHSYDDLLQAVPVVPRSILDIIRDMYRQVYFNKTGNDPGAIIPKLPPNLPPNVPPHAANAPHHFSYKQKYLKYKNKYIELKKLNI